MRWRIEEYFKFKKQCFDYENLRVRPLRSIRNLDFLLTMAIGYISKLSDKDDTMILRILNRLLGMDSFALISMQLDFRGK